jgi:hypothetical protein
MASGGCSPRCHRVESRARNKLETREVGCTDAVPTTDAKRRQHAVVDLCANASLRDSEQLGRLGDAHVGGVARRAVTIDRHSPMLLSNLSRGHNGSVAPDARIEPSGPPAGSPARLAVARGFRTQLRVARRTERGRDARKDAPPSIHRRGTNRSSTDHLSHPEELRLTGDPPGSYPVGSWISSNRRAAIISRTVVARIPAAPSRAVRVVTHQSCASVAGEISRWGTVRGEPAAWMPAVVIR